MESGATAFHWHSWSPARPSIEPTAARVASVLGNHTANEFIGESLVRPWLESVKVLVLIISPVWVSKLPGILDHYRRTRGAIDPAFRRFREILSFRTEVQPDGRSWGWAGQPRSFRKLLNCCIIQSSLGAGAAWTVFLDSPGFFWLPRRVQDDFRDTVLNLLLVASLQGQKLWREIGLGSKDVAGGPRALWLGQCLWGRQMQLAKPND